MSELVPNILALDKGLDLQSPKLTAPPGSVLDSLNYEQVDFQGQKRIDGYARYDGAPLSALEDFLLVPQLSNKYSTETTEDWPYTLAYYNGKLLGIKLGEDTYTTGTMDHLAVIDYTAVPPSAVFASESGLLTPAQQSATLLALNEQLRSLVSNLPGPISGLHWYGDRLYAVVDIGAYSPADTKINTTGNASLFESRTFQQVIEEDAPGPYDFGWRFVHQGWKVLFSNGVSLFGKLPAINQNRQGIGIEGPTSIDLNNGAAGVVTQNVDIDGLPAQVNGWKDTSTSTSYSLNPSAIQYLDTSYIYADAFIEWDATTGVVTGDAGTLIEYSPSNTIEIP